MKTKVSSVIVGILALISSSFVFADTYVKGYVKKDGTYVAPHYRSSPNSSKNDNWSTRGNTNPYTGEKGTKSPDYYGSQSDRSSPYSNSYRNQ